MAGKGIIHRNTAGRYKSRLTARLKAKTRLSRGYRPGAGRSSTLPHNSTTSRSST